MEAETGSDGAPTRSVRERVKRWKRTLVRHTCATVQAWSNEVIMEFLKLYEAEVVIWNPRHPHHRDRNAVLDGWKRIHEKLSVKCSIPELKKKKESLMATFRPLLIKVRASVKSGPGTDEVYKPSWFAYEAMESFLGTIYQPRGAINTEELIDTASADEIEDEEAEYNEAHEIHNYSDLPSDSVNSEDAFKTPQITRNKKRKCASVERIDNRMGDAYMCLKAVYDQPNDDKDECSLFLELLAKRLRTFDSNTRMILMHEIDDLIFRTRMQQTSTTNAGLPSYAASANCSQSIIHVQTAHAGNYPTPQTSTAYSHSSQMSTCSDHSQPSTGHSLPQETSTDNTSEIVIKNTKLSLKT